MTSEATTEAGDSQTAELRLPRSLPELEALIRRDLEILEYPSKPWLKQRQYEGQSVHDVVVVGGGHCGLTIGFALKREKIGNIIVLDENELGREGPWQTYARMPDLRTRKAVTGTDLGFSNLTYRAFFEARRGTAAYSELARITCEEWTAYLLWLRDILDVPFENKCRVDRIAPEGSIFRVSATRDGKSQTYFARRIILASGPLSMGGAVIPEVIEKGLPQKLYRHVYEPGEPPNVEGKEIVVIGNGASGFDNAGTALENGASSVHMLVRRPHVPRLSQIRWTDFAGFLNTFSDLDDERRWRLMREVQRNPAPPPIRAIRRVEKWPNFHIHFSSPVIAASHNGDRAILRTPREQVEADLILLATGFSVDMTKCKPLAAFADKIAVWSDRFAPPEGMASEKFSKSPYLGRRYQFSEKNQGEAPYLKHIFNFSQFATLSMGPTGRISGLKYGMRRLMQGVCESFMNEDFDRHLESIQNYNDSELDGHPWVEPPPKG